MFDLTGISADQEVFRAYAYENHREPSGKPSYKLFLRRKPPKDERGLSVGPSPQAATQPLKFHYGCCRLVTAQVRTIEGLDVVPDSDTHGNITGVPRRSEDEQRALQIAGDLQRMADSTNYPPSPPAGQQH